MRESPQHQEKEAIHDESTSRRGADRSVLHRSGTCHGDTRRGSGRDRDRFHLIQNVRGGLAVAHRAVVMDLGLKVMEGNPGEIPDDERIRSVFPGGALQAQ